VPDLIPTLTLAWEKKIHDNWGMKIAIHPFQPIVGTAGRDGQIFLGSYDEHGVIEKKKFDLRGSVSSLAFSRSGRLLVAGTRKGRIIAWHYPSLEPLTEWRAHRGEIMDLQFSPADRYLLSASRDKTAARWEIDPDGGVSSLAFRGHDGWVLGLDSFRQDGQESLVTASFDCMAILWDLRSGEPVRDFDPDADEIVDAVWCPARQILLTAAGEGQVHAWDLEKTLPIWHINVCKYPLTALALLSKQKKNLILATGWDFSIHVLDLDARAEASVTKGFGPNLIHDLKIDASEEYAFSLHADGCLRAWHITAGHINIDKDKDKDTNRDNNEG
jgi:WD40 repeat protein